MTPGPSPICTESAITTLPDVDVTFDSLTAPFSEALNGNNPRYRHTLAELFAVFWFMLSDPLLTYFML